MKTIVIGFLRDQSGAGDFNDGLTVFLLVVVFPIALYFVMLAASTMPFLVSWEVLFTINCRSYVRPTTAAGSGVPSLLRGGLQASVLRPPFVDDL